MVRWWKKWALSPLPTVWQDPPLTDTVAVSAKWPGWLWGRDLSANRWLQSASLWFAVLGAVSATLRPRCSRPRWLDPGKVQVRLNFWTSQRRGERESWLSQWISPHFSVIDLGRKSLSRSRVDGEGEVAAHQSVRDADCSCMLTWQLRSGGAAKWLLLIQLLGIKVDT